MVRGVVNLSTARTYCPRGCLRRGDKATKPVRLLARYRRREFWSKSVQGGTIEYRSLHPDPGRDAACRCWARCSAPRGLMPNPSVHLDTRRDRDAVNASKAGCGRVPCRRPRIVHCGSARTSFGSEQIQENIRAFADAVIKAKPTGAKGNYVKRVAISSTMGPGLKIDPSSLSVA